MRTTLIVGLLALGACASPRRGAPIVGTIQLSDNARRGQLVFMHDCNQCHPIGDTGLGPAINNKPIPRAVMKLQVRTGVLGSMPAFSKQELTEEDLDRVLDYVEALRKKGG